MAFERVTFAAFLVCCAPPPPPAPMQQPPPYTAPPPPPSFTAPPVAPAATQAQPIAPPTMKQAPDDRTTRCDESRADRAERLKRMTIARMEAENRLLASAVAIKAACKLGTKLTGTASIQRSGNGWRVSPELADDLKCSTLPKGISKDDAYVVMWRAREGSLKSTGTILESEDLSPDDRACADLDRAAGFDVREAQWDDAAALKRFATWKPVTPPPPASSP